MAHDNIKTRLDANQVIKRVYDDDTESLRTLATVAIGDITVEVDLDSDEDSVAIGNPNNGDTLLVNPDGSINVNAELTATDLDIRNLEFSTDKVDTSGSIIALDSTTISALGSTTVENGAGSSAVNIQDGGNSITIDGTVELGATTLAALETITVVATNLDIRSLSQVTDSIKIGDGTDLLVVNPDGSINIVGQVSGNVTITDPIEISQINSPIINKPSGTRDGTTSSSPFYWVYNPRQQILDSHDRVANFIYEDFGTKNQRVTQINYTSSTFAGVTVARIFNYTLIGNSYRRDSETWNEI